MHRFGWLIRHWWIFKDAARFSVRGLEWISSLRLAKIVGGPGLGRGKVQTEGPSSWVRDYAECRTAAQVQMLLLFCFGSSGKSHFKWLLMSAMNTGGGLWHHCWVFVIPTLSNTRQCPAYRAWSVGQPVLKPFSCRHCSRHCWGHIEWLVNKNQL